MPPDQVPDCEVAIIGAGFGGICAAIKLREIGVHGFGIVDRDEGFGGTALTVTRIGLGGPPRLSYRPPMTSVDPDLPAAPDAHHPLLTGAHEMGAFLRTIPATGHDCRTRHARPANVAAPLDPGSDVHHTESLPLPETNGIGYL